MNIKKIVMSGVLVLGISPCLVWGDNTAPDWVEKLRDKNSKYIGATWGNKKGNTYNNEVMIGNTVGIWVNHGRYNLTKDKEIGVAVLAKIVVTQSEPCYAVPKDFGFTRNISGETVPNEIKQAVKLKKDSVEISLGYAGGRSITGITKEIRFGLYNDKQATEENSRIILGKDLDCLTEPNEEIWEVYWKLKGKWVLMAEESFKLKTDKN